MDGDLHDPGRSGPGKGPAPRTGTWSSAIPYCQTKCQCRHHSVTPRDAGARKSQGQDGSPAVLSRSQPRCSHHGRTAVRGPCGKIYSLRQIGEENMLEENMLEATTVVTPARFEQGLRYADF